jgi:uncharacterized RDD family membrane protein YckC
VTVPGPLEQALASTDAPLDDVLDLVDAAVERAAEAGDDAELAGLAERFDEVASRRGGDWAALAIAAARARAFVRPRDDPSTAVDVEAPPVRPNPPPRVARDTGEEPPPQAGEQLVYAGWWRRALALVIDGFLLGVASDVIERAIGSVFGVVVLALAYFAVFPAVTGGSTPGKAALGIAIRRTDGSRIRLLRSLWRVISMWLLWVTVLGAVIDAILAGTDERRQSVHDKLADTIVLRGHSSY